MLDFIVNPIMGLFSNPLLALISFNILLAVGGLLYVVWDRMRVKQSIIFFSENERLYESIKIDVVTPLSLHSIKRGIRVFRTSPAYKSRISNSLLWLAKRGSGYIFKLESTPKGKAVKVGSLWDALKVVLGDELLNGLKDEYKNLLINPDYYLAVELESGLEPEGLPHITEHDIQTDTVRRMSTLIFSQIKEALKEDWVKLIMTLGMGFGLCLTAIRLGLI